MDPLWGVGAGVITLSNELKIHVGVGGYLGEEFLILSVI